ncbi:MAG: proline dehydrogenase family protein [Myxococcota bacterium]|nr:proline dehydrogenase family protein [Myxococcota bacterium]
MAATEARIREIGEDLFRRMRGNTPGVFNKAWWSGQILEWAMKDPDFKTEMFRFVDVFPVLTSPEEVNRHIREYLLKPGIKVPTVIKLALKSANLGKMAMRMATAQITKNLEGMAKNFIVGTDAASALPTLRELRKQTQAFTVDLLGEATVSEVEAAEYAARYAALIDGLAAECANWKESECLDYDDKGIIPRVNISIKVSAMYSQFDPLDFDRSVEAAAQRLLPLFQKAKAKGVFLNLDMEQHNCKDITLALFQRVLEDPSLDGFDDAGVVIQAYHRQAVSDLESLIGWARLTNKRITVRLVKGAYWDYETVKAAQEGWASPVWLNKGDSDVCFEKCAALMLKNHQYIRSAIGSHNVRSLAHSIATAEALGLAPNAYEIQCLYGMAEPIKAACIERGHRVRVYSPVGELIPGMAYLVRRLLENTSNESWLRQGFNDNLSVDQLLAKPTATDHDPMLRKVPDGCTDVAEPGPLLNEPLRDFTKASARREFRDALNQVQDSIGGVLGPVISGETVETGSTLDSVDPANPSSSIATVHLAGIDEANQALERAKTAFPEWQKTAARTRALLLFKLADAMRQKRDQLSALMVLEVGKTWREADADTAEAIDFCEYYGREMLRLSKPRLMQNLPGELNHLAYRGRGVTVVIAPWNFPLAIYCGMVSAALVTGNTVIGKPAEQSMAIAAEFMKIALDVGIPPDVLHFLPGRGEVVGDYLVRHADVANVVFTGSRSVGLSIWEAAGQTHRGQAALKRVVCEMGGKNAIIVDSDADLDEAVLGVIHSAFSFGGQKCSACSRVIILSENYDAFVPRLVEATRSLQVGQPTDAGSALGPLIDRESQNRLDAAIDDAAQRGVPIIFQQESKPTEGFFVGPTIIGPVDPKDPLAQDEFFGPLIVLIKVDSFEDAVAVLNDTDYALTGGLFSRSPSRIETARRELRVGNLYINRTITGAVVGRQPFGGGQMSGGGTKAGGPDYLLHFLDPFTITENTLRRGFAPDTDE